MLLAYIKLGFSKVVTFWERHARSGYHIRAYVLFVLCLFVILVISSFGFEGGTLGLIASFSGHCLHFLYIFKY